MKKIIIPVILVIIAVLIFASTVVTKSNEYTLIKEFGKVERIVSEPGLSFKLPFIQQTEKLPKTIMLFDQAESDVITKDKKTMVIDNFVLWKITDPLKFVQTLNTIPEAERRIGTVTYNAIKNAVGNINQTDIINGRGESLSDGIVKTVQPSFDEYGITIIDNEIKRLDLPEDNKGSVYARMISERNQIAADFLAQGNEEYQLILNDTNKEVSIIVSSAKAEAEEIRAQGESEYMKIIAEAYNSPERQEFYEFLRALDALKLAMKGDNKTVFLPIDSPLAKIFIGG
ncbi:MAG: protease modulator HflC [Ruminococcaceae bacterium]|nr:protease modulator HflC [Oscillospiraceae bacterium]